MGRNGYFLPMTLEPWKAKWFRGENVALASDKPLGPPFRIVSLAMAHPHQAATSTWYTRCLTGLFQGLSEISHRRGSSAVSVVSALPPFASV